ncbi:uncharacterized protein UBRO_20200 [Ustilago bromivora]|uniref:Uncharacterized protein n=1 Tax=Ustilago bromivora TaxID=307758 RepID=A0A1K0G7I8_9BASI|nr:uncharacterized protein UBRO_20200 [Ustilago bromivora]
MTEPDMKDRLEELQRMMERAEESIERLQTLNRAATNRYLQRLESLEALLGNNSQTEESTTEEPCTPSPAPRPQRTVYFLDQDEQSYSNYEKYASPTRPRYNPPYEGIPRDTEYDTKATGEFPSSQPKPLATPFPKFNPRDVEIFLIEADAWFMFNRVHDHKSTIHHTGPQLEESRHITNCSIYNSQVMHLVQLLVMSNISETLKVK